jgi:hypothetical protein
MTALRLTLTDVLQRAQQEVAATIHPLPGAIARCLKERKRRGKEGKQRKQKNERVSDCKVSSVGQQLHGGTFPALCGQHLK